VSGAPFVDDDKIRNFSEELRASIPIGQAVGLVIGGFFTHQVAEHDFYIPQKMSRRAILSDKSLSRFTTVLVRD